MNPLSTRFAGPWTAAEVRHLLTRTGCGFDSVERDQSLTEGMPATIDRLLTIQPESAEFQRSEATLKLAATTSGNASDLKAWWLYRLLHSRNSLQEKLTLFWHNHFATSIAKVQSVPEMLEQNELFRSQAWGNFRTLLHAVSKDVAMLVWLDGNANRKRHPNENFAREVMELFSLGVGNYTEKDIQEAARAFTGWHVRDGEFWFNTLQHDESPKTLFGKTGPFQGSQVIDLCADQPACAKYLAFKLLRTFVVDVPTPEEIAAVAERLRQHQLELKPVLRELFTSAWFYSQEVRNRLIKSPVELVLGTCRTLGVAVRLPAIITLLAELGQDVFQPPSVKGWDGGRLWINATSALLRANFVTELATSEKYGKLPELSSRLTSGARGTSAATVRFFAEQLLNQPLAEELLVQLAALFDTTPGSFDQKLKVQFQLLGLQPEFQFH